MHTPLMRRILLLAAALSAGAASAQIGLAQFDAGGLPVTLTYPTAAAASPQNFGPVTLTVAPGAALAPGARRRLIVMSHGTGGSASVDHDLAATLAHAGFVVAQPLHAGDNFADTSKAGPESWQRRPGEVSRVIDALAAHPQWSTQLRLDRVGVHGMSAGGVTALALAGAQWRLLNLLRHCNQHLEADIAFCFNGALDPARQAERRASFERARGVPEAFLPETVTARHGGRTPPAGAGTDFDPRPDPRIVSVTLAVPVAAVFDAASLARIRVPVGLLRAGADGVLAPAFHADHIRRHCTRCELLADLGDAGHFDVLSPWPEAIAQQTARSFLRGGEPTPGFDPQRLADAHAALRDFHRRQLGQD